MKPLLALVVAVLLLAGVALVRRWDALFGESTPARAPVEETKDVRKLPAVDPNLIEVIELDDGKEKVELARAGDRWVLPGRFDHPANPDLVKGLFDGLVDLDRSEYVASNPSKHHLFQVDAESGKRLTLKDGTGRVIVDLMVGTRDLAGGRTYANARTFVRQLNSQDVYAHSGPLAAKFYSAMPRTWLNTRLTTDDPKDIQHRVEEVERLVIEYDDIELGVEPMPGMPPVERTGERVRLVLVAQEVEPEMANESSQIGPEAVPVAPAKAKVRQWKFVEPESAQDIEVHGPMVEGVVRQMFGGTMEDVKGKDLGNPEFGLDQPVVEAHIELKDGTSRGIRIGALVPPAEGSAPTAGMSSRFANMEGSPFVVSVPEYLSRMLQKKPDELKMPTGGALPGPPGRSQPGSGEIVLPDEQEGAEKGKDAAGDTHHDDAARPLRKQSEDDR